MVPALIKVNLSKQSSKAKLRKLNSFYVIVGCNDLLEGVKEYENPLVLAIACGKRNTVKTVQTLFDAGSKVNVVDSKSDLTPLIACIRHHNMS